MSRHHKTLARVLSGSADSNVRVDHLRGLLKALGFVERIRGSHHILGHPGIREVVNLQGTSGSAKPYQVRQIRRILVRSGLVVLPGGNDDD